MTQANQKAVLNVLVCDDNNQFVTTLVESLVHKMLIRYGITPASIQIVTITNINRIQSCLQNPTEIGAFDMVFCDLGWSELTLKGVQLLHDIKMANPGIYTVLYTAQDEDSIVSQALGWQLDFVDQMIKIEGKNYFEEILTAIVNQFYKKIVLLVHDGDTAQICQNLESFLRSDLHEESYLAQICRQQVADYFFEDLFPQCAQILRHKNKLPLTKIEEIRSTLHGLIDQISESKQFTDIVILGQHHLESQVIQSEVFQGKLKSLQQEMSFILDLQDGLATDISLSKAGLQIKFKPDPQSHLIKRYLELFDKIKLFPRVEEVDLIALNKQAYIEFIKKNYGGFPQMAQARGLDLNNIYRVNRRFKQNPFVVFQCLTVREIVGIYDRAESDQVIKSLLATKAQIFEVINAQK